jgi:large subunit ribosomal protein L5e
MKGAVDGGLAVPHKNRRFPGYDAEGKSFDAGVLRDFIFGEHVANYMRELQENDEAEYKSHFSKYIEAGVSADDMEEMYKKAHAAIRADPLRKKKEAKEVESKRFGRKRQNLKERKERIRQKKAAFLQRLAAMEAAEE